MSTDKWEQRYKRERHAREQAEILLEEKARDLSNANLALERTMASLEDEVRRQTAELRAEIELRKNMEVDLILARDEALHLSEQRESFLARVSHEVRTPLNSILGYTQLLLQSGLAADAQAKLDSVHGSASLLLDIVNDLLDVSKVDSGKMEVQPEPSNVVEIVERSLALVQPLAAEKGLELSLQKDFALPNWLYLDGKHLLQIVTNLVSNAVKYTPSGSVCVRLSLHELAPEAHRQDIDRTGEKLLQIAVEDTGPGIPRSQHAALFDPYVRLSSGSENTGSGLGLAISHRLTTLLDGDLQVNSTVGQGSCFTLTVPCTVCEPHAIGTPNQTPAPVKTKSAIDAYRNLATRCPLRILTVDDNQVNQQVLEGLLELFGYHTDLAGDGLDALHAAESSLYDVILMDVRMPHVNGKEATRRIRENQNIRQPYIIAVTASAIEGDRERFLAAGMDAYLSKPVDALELARALENAYGACNPAHHLDAGQGFTNSAPNPAGDGSELIDLEEMRDRLGNALDPLLSKVVPVFLREIDGRLHRLDGSLSEKDVLEVAQISHSLKGSALSVGAKPLAEVCHQMQTAADNGELPSSEAVTSLAELCRSSASQLREIFPNYS